MMDRRQIILGLVSLAALASQHSPLIAATNNVGALSWPAFTERLKELSQRFAARRIDQQEMERQGLALIARLDTGSASFKQAEADSFESGNAFWLWQRMIRTTRLDGGILNIDRSQMIPLHDHPNATGMVRIMSGEAELWKFERLDEDRHRPGAAELRLIDHGVLRPGETAIVTPQGGNIHALRSLSAECRMLDFFIPPFDRRTLLYFKPDEKNWFDKTQLSCRAIPRTEFVPA